MLNLQRVAMFVAVADAGSFTSAAASSGQTKAAISASIQRLESELGIALMLRTTRRLTLTQAGAAFYQRSLQLLKDAEQIANDVRLSHHGFRGELCITSTAEYGSEKVIPALVAFGQLHPELSVRHVSSSSHADLVSERFDIAIRLGKLADSSYHAALIDRFSILPVATPKWLAANPIHSLEDLGKAPWIIHNRLKSPFNWQIVHSQGQQIDFEIVKSVRYFTDSASSLMSFVLQDCGVGLLPEWLVRPMLLSGKLTHLLPQYAFPQQGIYAVYPNTRHVPAKVRALIDFLRLQIGYGEGD